jgi:hypothetical protein
MSNCPRFKNPADQEWYEERAAILEYDALMSRPRAEAKAYLLALQMIIEMAQPLEKRPYASSRGR